MPIALRCLRAITFQSVSPPGLPGPDSSPQPLCPRRASSPTKSLFARTQEFLDGPQDRLAIRDPAGDHVVFLLDHLLDVIEELAAAVGALDLAVAEEVELGQQAVGQDLDAVGDVVAPVVAVGEVESVEVPLVRRKTLRDDLIAHLIGAAD